MGKQPTAVVLLILLVTAGAVAQTHTREVALAPGQFAPVSGAHLGKPVNFENEIDTHSCLPLIIIGKTVAWLTRAYEVAGRLFVRRCKLYKTSEVVSKGGRPGGANDAWERASMGRRHRLHFTQLRLPNWNFMSNPTFCDSYIAYWGLQGDTNNLIPSIHNLVTDVPVVARALGPVSLETDDEDYIPQPTWDVNCSQASFDGRPINKNQIDLAVEN